MKLEQTIKACGYKFESLTKTDKGWKARSVSIEVCKNHIFQRSYHKVGFDEKCPLKAVERLHEELYEQFGVWLMKDHNSKNLFVDEKVYEKEYKKIVSEV